MKAEADKQASQSTRPSAGNDGVVISNEELATLVALQNQVHKSETAQELAIFACNETHNLSSYFQAVLWQRNTLNVLELLAVSGVSNIDKNAIVARYILRLIKEILAMEDANEPRILGLRDVSASLREEWIELMPPHIQWLPFTKNDRTEAGMIIFYEQPINRKRELLFEPLVSTYSHVWYGLPENRRKEKGVLARMSRSSRAKWLIFFIVLGVLAIPVRESALAPAQVVATKPTIVGASISGIINKVHVPPNQFVKEGQLLVSLDATEAISGLEIAETELESAKTEYVVASQRAFSSAEAKSEIALLSERVKAAELKVLKAKDVLERTRIYASRPGIAIYTDEYEFLGQMVDVGQRIMLLADVDEIEMNISMPVGDTIDFNVGDEVSLFLNTDPARPVKATLSQTSYEPRVDNSGDFVFQMKARFNDPEFEGRIGWAGTAKVYSSKRVTLFMYLFRRPISSLRRWFGW